MSFNQTTLIENKQPSFSARLEDSVDRKGASVVAES